MYMTTQQMEQYSAHQPDCNFTTQQLVTLRKHLEDTHDLEFETQTLIFSTIEGNMRVYGTPLLIISFNTEFRQWKTMFEEETTTSFVKNTGKKIDSHGNEIQYYYCNRSGHYTSKSKGHRKTKTQGTCKLNRYCTALIKTSTDTITGAVETEVCCTHYGPEIYLAHIRLPDHIRLAISRQLHQGVSMQHILIMSKRVLEMI